MRLSITTEPLSEEETEVILGAYDSARAAYDAVQTDNWENARAEFRDLCNAVAEWAAPEADQRAEALRGQLLEMQAMRGSMVTVLQRLLTNPIDEDARAAARGVLAWVSGGRT